MKVIKNIEKENEWQKCQGAENARVLIENIEIRKEY